MAIQASAIPSDRNKFDLVRQAVPPPDRMEEFCRRLLAINELSRMLNAVSDLNSLVQRLANYYVEHHAGDSIALYIRDGAQYRRISLSGPSTAGEQIGATKASGIPGSVIRCNAPLWIKDTHSPRRLHQRLTSEQQAFGCSVLVVPFSAMNRVVGCIEMLSNLPNRFDETEYHLALLLAGHLSSAYENILMRQELETANARLRDHDSRLTQLNEKLRELAHTDETTGLFNKRRLFERLEMEVARAKRYGEVLSCLMIDVDDFKKINDIHGHPAGDKVLRQIGDLLQRSLRVTDFKARFGGDEFTVLLPRTNGAGASSVSEKLRSAFMTQTFTLPVATVRLTVSIGVASCTRFESLDALRIIQLADLALYRAKKTGKNKVCFADHNGLVDLPESQKFVKHTSSV